jgi:hypothetical protein
LADRWTEYGGRAQKIEFEGKLSRLLDAPGLLDLLRLRITLLQ